MKLTIEIIINIPIIYLQISETQNLTSIQPNKVNGINIVGKLTYHSLTGTCGTLENGVEWRGGVAAIHRSIRLDLKLF